MKDGYGLLGRRRGVPGFCSRCGRKLEDSGYRLCPACREMANRKNKRHRDEIRKNRGGNEFMRVCHDCGKPTPNYRCEECWRKIRGRSCPDCE